MQTFEIRHRFTDAVLYSGGGETLRDVVEQAVKAGANLAGANLAGANLTDANLADANLTGANLAGANLTDANLADANLTGAYLADAYLAGANLADANLAGAYLARAYLAGAKGPKGLHIVGARPLLQIGPLGSRSALLSAWLTEEGVYVMTGCFTGTLDEFRTAVEKTHGENDHANEYGMAMLMIEAHAVLWTPNA